MDILESNVRITTCTFSPTRVSTIIQLLSADPIFFVVDFGLGLYGPIGFDVGSRGKSPAVTTFLVPDW